MKESGQSLFEVVVALGVMALLVIGLVGVSTSSVRNTTFSTNTTTATNYAQDTSQWLRNQSDSSWSTFENNVIASTTYCLNNDPSDWTNTGACASTEIIASTVFTRQVSFTCSTNKGVTLAVGTCVAANRATINAIQANITVSWTDGQGTHNVNVSNLLTNWKSG